METPEVLQQNLEEWLAVHESIVTTPSGLKIKIKKATLQNLAINGEIPLPLITTYDEATDKYTKAENLTDTVEAATQMNLMYEAVTLAVLVWPKIDKIRDIAHGKILITDLSLEDKHFIYTEAIKGYTLLDKFREEQIPIENPA